MKSLSYGVVLLVAAAACGDAPAERGVPGRSDTAVRESTSRIPCTDAQELVARVVYPNGTTEVTDHRDALCRMGAFTVTTADGRLSLFAEDVETVEAVMEAVTDGYENDPDYIDPLWMRLVDLYNGRVQARGFPMRLEQRDVIEVYAPDGQVIADVDCRRRPCIQGQMRTPPRGIGIRSGREALSSRLGFR